MGIADSDLAWEITPMLGVSIASSQLIVDPQRNTPAMNIKREKHLPKTIRASFTLERFPLIFCCVFRTESEGQPPPVGQKKNKKKNNLFNPFLLFSKHSLNYP